MDWLSYTIQPYFCVAVVFLNFSQVRKTFRNFVTFLYPMTSMLHILGAKSSYATELLRLTRYLADLGSMLRLQMNANRVH